MQTAFFFSKLQYNNVAFVVVSKRATVEGSLPKIAQNSQYYLPLNVFFLLPTPYDQPLVFYIYIFLFLFCILFAGTVGYHGFAMKQEF